VTATVQSFDAVIESPVGRLGIRMQGLRVRGVDFLTACCALRPASGAASRRVVAALRAYFADARQLRQVDVVLDGTDFQQRVWHALRGIPAGQVMTYGALAKQLGSSARAVGNACRHNPLPILVPCHRVVAASGLGGFAGDLGGRLVDIKRCLLAHEGVEMAAPRPHVSP
jgi:methylated-DNA-[protein]-cysteine S-methyltransferase